MVHIPEPETINTCNLLARQGFLFGGSTGTVVSGAVSWLTNRQERGLTSVAIAPDLGERYLGTIYDADWARDTYNIDAEDLKGARVRTRSA